MCDSNLTYSQIESETHEMFQTIQIVLRIIWNIEETLQTLTHMFFFFRERVFQTLSLHVRTTSCFRQNVISASSSLYLSYP